MDRRLSSEVSMKKTLSASIVASTLLFAALATPAHASSSNFQMSCAFGFPNTLVSCTVDAGKPAGSPSSCVTMGLPATTFNSYFWVWGDGAGSQQAALHTFNSGHQYSSPPSYVTVCQTILCADNTSATNCRTLCTLTNTASCNAGTIIVNGTFN
jgi:hypothetical protein